MAGMRRRILLSAVGLAVAPLAGCGGNPGDAVVNMAEQSAAESADVVAYADLLEAERRIARTAVKEDFYGSARRKPRALARG